MKIASSLRQVSGTLWFSVLLSFSFESLNQSNLDSAAESFCEVDAHQQEVEEENCESGEVGLVAVLGGRGKELDATLSR